jgi:nicotinate-nucleotide adenylyltransferase
VTDDGNAPLGILGGTFDPIHHGHLRLAEEVFGLCAFGRLLLVPGGIPPHRAAPGVTAAHRLAMARLAANGNPRFAVDDREVRKATPSYTVDTLAELRGEVGPARPVALVVGADAFVGLPSWSRWTTLFSLAHIVVAGRPGFALAPEAPALRAELDARRFPGSAREALASAPAGRIVPVETTLLDISASAIRRCLAAGESARYLLPDAVLDYIGRNRLYQGAR